MPDAPSTHIVGGMERWIGLAAVDGNGRRLGSIRAVHADGAVTWLELGSGEGASVFAPASSCESIPGGSELRLDLKGSQVTATAALVGGGLSELARRRLRDHFGIEAPDSPGRSVSDEPAPAADTRGPDVVTEQPSTPQPDRPAKPVVAVSATGRYGKKPGR